MRSKMASLDQKLVRENAQAIDCRCFDSQNDWAKRDRLAAVATRQRKLRRGKIALGPHEHQYASGAISVLAQVHFQNAF